LTSPNERGAADDWGADVMAQHLELPSDLPEPRHHNDESDLFQAKDSKHITQLLFKNNITETLALAE